MKHFVKSTKLSGKAKSELTVCFILEVSYRVVGNDGFHTAEEIFSTASDRTLDATQQRKTTEQKNQLLFFKRHIVVFNLISLIEVEDDVTCYIAF